VAYEDHITLTINYNQTFPKWVKFKTRPKKLVHPQTKNSIYQKFTKVNAIQLP